MSENIYVVGVSMTPFGKMLDRSIKSLTKQAVDEALTDSGIDKEKVGVAAFANVSQGHMEGQHSIRGPIALRSMGFEEIPIMSVENACASGATALNIVLQYLKAGEAEVGLAVGAEKLFSEDKLKMFNAFDSGWDIEEAEANKEALISLGRGVKVPEGTTSPAPYSVFMDVYVSFARAHMRDFGTTQEQIAAVAAKNHQHSVYNELAQYRNSYTIEEILNAPPITYPLTLPMCSPISDGASAAILCTESFLQENNIDKSRAIKVLSSVIQTGSNREADDYKNHITVKVAKRAYEKAGLGPDDVSLAEVHDATAMGEIIQVENLGFCEFGEGGVISLRGDTKIGGRIPVNPSGGLESKGHPIGATGIGQIYELVLQLRGEAGMRQVENARIALAENGGGLYGVEEAVCGVTILSK